MDRIGVIGTGSMGSMLVEAWLKTNALSPGQVTICNRTPEKAENLVKRHPGLHLAENNLQLVRASQVLLLCVKPLEYSHVLEQIAPALTSEHLLITITSPITLDQLEERVPARVARVIPSITNAAKSGVSLCEFGSRIEESHRQFIFSLFSSISQPVEIVPPFLRISADLISCGPAFLSYTLQQMIEDAVSETGISREAATYLVTQMVIGVGQLLQQELFTLPALQARVCVPGGVTGEGLKVMQERLPGMFAQVFARTQAKFAEDQELTAAQLSQVPAE
ncbi:late competence protein ComER [Brevibacillus sp. TJ4]|uniref:late competence protein ComER n=1 Tax=Brevibacillus sp. TJ4 TaxID=3234853 RepID=UPI0037D4977C